MKLTVFQSDKGDCLLLTSADSRNMLIDGGMRASYTDHVSPALNQLHAAGGKLDVVYVSHIDRDHISGVLQLMDDEVEWRIHEYQIENGNPKHKPPMALRPPEVKAIWHNAFHEQILDNAGAIEEMLAASAAVLSGLDDERVEELVSAQNELVTSIAEAIQLTRRVGADQLGIKVNSPARGKLMLVRPAKSRAIRLGRMRFRIIGPFSNDLKKLRKEWNEWLEKNQSRLKSIEAKAVRDESQFNIDEIADILSPKLLQATRLSELLPLSEAGKPTKLGERRKVTTPNLASLMFFVEEDGKTLLLTGDGHHLDILRGLKHIKKLKKNKGIHLDALKVQHHGSEYNLDEPFCKTVTADNYIFCGNGEHGNPDLRVLQAIADSRFGKDSQRSSNKEVNRPFKFWINSHTSVTRNADAKKHMKDVESLLKKLSKESKGQMSFFLLKGSSFDVQI